MRKLLKIVFPIFLILSLCIPAFADGSSIVTENHDCDTHDHFEVIFSDETPFTTEQQEYIAAVLSDDGNPVSTYGFTCWLLGHKYEYDTVITITHCVNSTQPRCLKETFQIGICSRCNETTTELINQTYITCCP